MTKTLKVTEPKEGPEKTGELNFDKGCLVNARSPQ